ncbi:hypothetical protein CC80DRAFT_318908 [Byssothecium circinans]|uniref:Something about silencing protein 4 domain-containing protein n=1 Tax=Byssothecium circinans TaxID=147558 RepID=A0A6A5U839_9PLEO|nr:hypothetical protein CC80DRAFT_318908 [Byssothecium circinans]
MLKAMANLIRPATERRVQRHNKSRSPPAAAAAASTGTDSAHRQLERSTQPPIQDSIAVATRRTARSTPRISLHDRIAEETPATPAVSSRKRPASALADDATTDARPPVKVTVTQPHGELLRITNGVPKHLGIGADEIPSARSTPSASSGAGLSVPVQTPQAQQPGSANSDKRSLRSQDGSSRLKSDLSTYFTNYDEIMDGVEKTSDFLNIDTPIYLVDEPIKSLRRSQDLPMPEAARKSASPSRSRKARAQTPTRKPSNAMLLPPSQSSTSFQEIDYSTITNIIKTDTDDDPLADPVYFAQHRRAERKEKQLRNIEKERAQHEKGQLEKLLDGLQGPDWLKTMGITGVTDGEKVKWEPKRDYFIKEVETLMEKFRRWKEQEKRVRAGKEAAVAKEESEEDDSESEPDANKPNGKQSAVSPHSKAPSPPKPRRPPRPHGFLLPILTPVPTTPFQSFYSKPHLRAAALGKHRHGRNASAFGQPIPEWEAHDFELPEDFVTPEFLRDNARKRRRRKRESISGPL